MKRRSSSDANDERSARAAPNGEIGAAQLLTPAGLRLGLGRGDEPRSLRPRVTRADEACRGSRWSGRPAHHRPLTIESSTASDIPPSAGPLRSVAGIQRSPLLSRVLCTTCSGLGVTRVVELGHRRTTANARRGAPSSRVSTALQRAERSVLGVASRTHPGPGNGRPCRLPNVARPGLVRYNYPESRVLALAYRGPAIRSVVGDRREGGTCHHSAADAPERGRFGGGGARHRQTAGLVRRAQPAHDRLCRRALRAWRSVDDGRTHASSRRARVLGSAERADCPRPHRRDADDRLAVRRYGRSPVALLSVGGPAAGHQRRPRSAAARPAAARKCRPVRDGGERRWNLRHGLDVARDEARRTRAGVPGRDGPAADDSRRPRAELGPTIALDRWPLALAGCRLLRGGAHRRRAAMARALHPPDGARLGHPRGVHARVAPHLRLAATSERGPPPGAIHAGRESWCGGHG